MCGFFCLQEKEVRGFVESFAATKAAKLTELQQRQDAVVQLLEKIAKQQNIATGNLPNQKKFKEMQASGGCDLFLVSVSSQGYWSSQSARH